MYNKLIKNLKNAYIKTISHNKHIIYYYYFLHKLKQYHGTFNKYSLPSKHIEGNSRTQKLLLICNQSQSMTSSGFVSPM